MSRTKLNPHNWDKMNTIVFRVVLANPLTTKEILQSVLDEQREISMNSGSLMKEIIKLTHSILK